jgi:FKBP-type peptidyl-prolyl cis-trans isomerase
MAEPTDRTEHAKMGEQAKAPTSSSAKTKTTSQEGPRRPAGSAEAVPAQRIYAARLLLLAVAVALVATLAGCKRSQQEKTSEAKTETTATSAAATSTAAKGDIPAPDNVAAPPADAEKTASGLASIVLKPGKGGDKPTERDTVKVHYTGWSKDGKMFDSSEKRGRPATFGVTRVIKGWTEGLQLMTEGEKRRFWIPAELAYGDTPRRPGAPSGQLTFDVELLEIKKAPPPPEVPEDVKAPPATATKTKSGLAYRVLTKGDGTDHPTKEDRVRVHYTGWTPDGKMFDSSIVRERPATFKLTGVIPGWTEGLQLMTKGEKARFWIPADLAYGDKPTRPGAPSGPLVFDVELLTIMKAPKSPHGASMPAHPGVGAKVPQTSKATKSVGSVKATPKPTQ